MRNIIIRLLTGVTYLWGSIWYDKKFFVGENFDRNSLSGGWKWILKYWFPQKVLGYARNVPYPIPRGVNIANPQNIIFHPDDMRNLHAHGSYFQGLNAKVYIGKGTRTSLNCGFITANHDKKNLNNHEAGKDIVIGENCWIGMNCVILPGVILGKNTIVGAGSIVTKSFEEGNCVIAGNPAKIIKRLE